LLGGPRLLLLFENALVEVAYNHPGQPFIVDEEALPDWIWVLFWLLRAPPQYLVGGEAAVDEALDIANPVFDNLALLPLDRPWRRLAVPGDNCLDVQRLNTL